MIHLSQAITQEKIDRLELPTGCQMSNLAEEGSDKLIALTVFIGGREKYGGSIGRGSLVEMDSTLFKGKFRRYQQSVNPSFTEIVKYSSTP